MVPKPGNGGGFLGGRVTGQDLASQSPSHCPESRTDWGAARDSPSLVTRHLPGDWNRPRLVGPMAGQGRGGLWWRLRLTSCGITGAGTDDLTVTKNAEFPS